MDISTVLATLTALSLRAYVFRDNPLFLRIYSGSQPATADSAATGTLLGYVRLVVPPTEFTASGVEVGVGPASGAPSGPVLAAGTAGWGRVVVNVVNNTPPAWLGDGTGETGTDTVMFDGTVGTVGTDFILDDITLTVGNDITLSSMTVQLPVG